MIFQCSRPRIGRPGSRLKWTSTRSILYAEAARALEDLKSDTSTTSGGKNTRRAGSLRLCLLLCFALVVVFALLPLRKAEAHPLGNFTINHYSRIEFSDEVARHIHPGSRGDPDPPAEEAPRHRR